MYIYNRRWGWPSELEFVILRLTLINYIFDYATAMWPSLEGNIANNCTLFLKDKTKNNADFKYERRIRQIH